MGFMAGYSVKKDFAILPALCLIFILCPTLSSHAAEPLLYLGYFHSQTTSFGFHFEEAADFTNLVFIDPARQEQADDIFDPEIGIPRAVQLGQQVVLALDGAMFQSRNAPELYDDFLGQLALKLKVRDYLNPETILAISVIDEPPNHAFSLEDQEIALEVTERYFPGIPKWINYSIGQVQSELISIPEQLDLVSFDGYYFSVNSSELSRAALFGFYERGMKGLREKAPGKPVFLFGQSFQSPLTGHFMPTEEQMQWQVEYAERTPEIVGLIWFMLGSGQPDKESEHIIGAIDFPETLEIHRKIGRRLAPGLFQPAER
jgi:hypothetical protein